MVISNSGSYDTSAAFAQKIKMIKIDHFRPLRQRPLFAKTSTALGLMGRFSSIMGCFRSNIVRFHTKIDRISFWHRPLSTLLLPSIWILANLRTSNISMLKMVTLQIPLVMGCPLSMNHPNYISSLTT